MWGIDTILLGLHSFMVLPHPTHQPHHLVHSAISPRCRSRSLSHCDCVLVWQLEDTPTVGSITTPDEHKRKFALNSMAFNCRNPTFRRLFPELVEEFKQANKAVRFEGATTTPPTTLTDTSSCLTHSSLPVRCCASFV